MTAHIVGGVTVALGTGPVRAEYRRSPYDGTQTAWLIIGDGPGVVAISTIDSPADVLDQLAEEIARLAAHKRRIESRNTRLEVA